MKEKSSKIEANKESKFISTDIDTFAKEVDVLRTLIRYQNCNRLVNESVAEHTFFVAAFVLKLRDYFKFDLLTALKTALVHDFPETKISDVPHNIKSRNPELSSILAKIEKKVAEERLSEEAASLIEDFNELKTPEGLVCALADILSVILYAEDEVKCGNTTFNYIAIKAIQRTNSVLDSLKPYLEEGVTIDLVKDQINSIINIS